MKFAYKQIVSMCVPQGDSKLSPIAKLLSGETEDWSLRAKLKLLKKEFEVVLKIYSETENEIVTMHNKEVEKLKPLKELSLKEPKDEKVVAEYQEKASALNEKTTKAAEKLNSTEIEVKFDQFDPSVVKMSLSVFDEEALDPLFIDDFKNKFK